MTKDSKTALDAKRNAAFSVTIKGRNETDPSKHVEMFPIGDQFYVFKDTCIFQLQTPDEIDPERLHPETRGATKEVYDIGTSHPIVSRTIIQAKRILNSMAAPSGMTKDDIYKLYFDFFKELEICNRTYESMVDDLYKADDQASVVLEESKNSGFVNDIPQIPDLENRTRGFFLTAKKALSRLLDFAYVLHPNSPIQNFEKFTAWLKESKGSDNPLTKMLNDDLTWITNLWEVRNAIEHPKSEKYNFEVRNIELDPKGKFRMPAWRYRTPQVSQETFVDLIHDLEVYLNNLLGLGEELLVLSVHERLGEKTPFIVYKVSEDKINPHCPVRYDVTVDPSKFPIARKAQGA